MREIIMFHGLIARVDDEDFNLVAPFRWHATAPQGERRYAVRSLGRSSQPRAMYMHRLILAAPAGLDVDHIDGDGLNNTRANLRLCTRGENVRNARKWARATGSRFKGVRRHNNRWETHVAKRYIGGFEDEVDAALAYDAAARIQFGPFARPNFNSLIEAEAARAL